MPTHRYEQVCDLNTAFFGQITIFSKDTGETESRYNTDLGILFLGPENHDLGFDSIVTFTFIVPA